MPLVFYDGPRFVVICLLIICLCDVPSAAAKDTTESYPASFFSSYAPRTALDMVHHLPGFQFAAGNQGRRGVSRSEERRVGNEGWARDGWCRWGVEWRMRPGRR